MAAFCDRSTMSSKGSAIYFDGFNVKRFYKQAEFIEVRGGFGVALDQRPMKTPAKFPLVVPAIGLAKAIAEEWNGQGGVLSQESMRVTRLACTAIDRVPSHRVALLDELAAYGETDLVCYRAGEPQVLVERQAAAWDPLIAWVAKTHDAALNVTTGIRPIGQPEQSIARLRAAADALDPFRLAALHLATNASGSLVLALALLAERLDAHAAFETSQIDENFQIEQWGEDAEFERQRAARRAELEAAARVNRYLREGADAVVPE
jgi:chaperone required for assembly of F1-ATPase